MRNFLIFALLQLTTLLNAQYSDLANMATGELNSFKPIVETNGDIYGYLAIYDLGKLNRKEREFEYIVLDPNLNKVANGKFIDELYRSYNYDFYDVSKSEDQILIGKINYIDSSPKFSFLSYRLLDLNSNQMSKSFYIDKDLVIEGNHQKKNQMLWAKKHKYNNIAYLISSGWINDKVLKNPFKGAKSLTSISSYNFDLKKKWDFNFNPDKKRLSHQLLHVDNDVIILMANHLTSRVEKIYKIDAKTGDLIYMYELENKDSPYIHDYNIELLNDNLIIVGKMGMKSWMDYHDKDAVGIFRIELDNAGQEVSKKYTLWKDLTDKIDIDNDGKFEDNYYLGFTQFHVFPDGSSVFLTEKSKLSYNLAYNRKILKTTDFVLLYLNPNFELTKVETIEKDKTKYYTSDYLYSQTLDDKQRIAFFYRDLKTDDHTRDKDWVLGIITVKEDTTTHHETIPMTSDDHLIMPYIAKEGYIILREFNNKEEYDQIRLEKLNY